MPQRSTMLDFQLIHAWSINPCSIYQLARRSFLTCLLLILSACSGGMNEQQMLQSAKQYINEGDLRAASIQLKNTLQTNNKNAEARYLLGNLSMKMGHYKAALQAFSLAEGDGWNKEEIQLNRAKIYIEQQNFQKLLDDIPDDISWSNQTRANILALHSMAHAWLEHIHQAKNTLEQARALKPDALHVLKATAIFQLSSLLDGDADKTINNALSLYPDNPELLLLRAGLEAEDKNPSQASNTYKKIISLNSANVVTPYSRKASIALAHIQFTQQEYSKASATLTKILASNENDTIANYLSGLINFKKKNYLRAENHLHKVLTQTPNHSRSLQLMGQVKYANKEYELASQNFIRYLKIEPHDIDTQKMLAQTYILLNQPDKAQSLMGELLAHDANDVTSLRLQSQILFSNGQTSAAFSSLLKAIKIEPDNILLREQLIKAYIASGKTNEALNQITTLQSLSKDTKNSQRLTVLTYVQTGDIDKAINTANKILKANSNDVETLSLIGSLHASNRDSQQARQYFNRSLQQSNNLSAAVGLAALNKQEGRLDEARALYKNLINANLGGTLPMLAMSELAALEKDESKMLSWLEKARTASKKEVKARLILANYYLQKTKAEQADIYIQEALKISPEKLGTLLLHSKILIAQNRYNEALPPLKKLTLRIPNSIDAHVLLGKVLLQQNMTTKAREHLLTALELDNNHVLARILLTHTELKEGLYEKSLSHAKHLQKAHPDLSMGYILEGDTWMLQQNPLKAHLSYSRAWTHQQTSTLATKLFSASRAISSFDDAIKPLTFWLSDNPDDISIHLFLAVAFQSANRNKEAIDEYEIALKLEPNNKTALNNIAWLYSLSGDSRALKFAEKAYRSAPNNAGIQDTYGWILVQNKQAKKGVKLIKKAFDRAPDILEIQYHYAVALVESGDEDQGKKILIQLLKQKKEFDSREKAQQLFNKL